MNLRLDRKQIRFRLTQDEVQMLREQGRLEEPLPAIGLQPHRFAAQIDDVATLTLSGDTQSLTLHLPAALAEELATTKPSKDGITVSQSDKAGNMFEIVLEVDVRKAR